MIKKDTHFGKVDFVNSTLQWLPYIKKVARVLNEGPFEVLVFYLILRHPGDLKRYKNTKKMLSLVLSTA